MTEPRGNYASAVTQVDSCWIGSAAYGLPGASLCFVCHLALHSAEAVSVGRYAMAAIVAVSVKLTKGCGNRGDSSIDLHLSKRLFVKQDL
jgi:hypothetical protein